MSNDPWQKYRDEIVRLELELDNAHARLNRAIGAAQRGEDVRAALGIAS